MFIFFDLIKIKRMFKMVINKNPSKILKFTLINVPVPSLIKVFLFYFYIRFLLKIFA